MDRNCLSYWFPKLAASGVPVPETHYTVLGDDWPSLARVLDGDTPQLMDVLVDRLRNFAKAVGGYPVFLRTGQTSGKHNWRHCCHVGDPSEFPRNVAGLVEFSEMADFLGLPYPVWVVREMLPVEPVAVLPRYNGMPLVREVRAFVSGGEVVCKHAYWPTKAIIDGSDGNGVSAEAIHAAQMIPVGDLAELDGLLRGVAAAFAGDGEWSVDVLWTRRGLYVTDMAEAARSFHMPGCPHEFR